MSFRVVATSSQKPALIAWGWSWISLVSSSYNSLPSETHFPSQFLLSSLYSNHSSSLTILTSWSSPRPNPRRGRMGSCNGCYRLWFILWLEAWDDVNLCWYPWFSVCWSAWKSCGQFEACRWELWCKLYNHGQFMPSLTWVCLKSTVGSVERWLIHCWSDLTNIKGQREA